MPNKLSTCFNDLFTHAIKFIASPACYFCQQPASTHLPLCHSCQQQLPYLLHTYQHAIAAFAYEELVSQLIIQLKFHNNLLAAKILGNLFAGYLKKIYQKQTLPDMIIPIPLHPIRLRERGFNQSQLIASYVAKKLNIPINNDYCKRTRATLAQSSLPAEKRRHNIKNAFVADQRVRGKHIVLLDDVITTGHTVTECALTLLRQQAKCVEIWTVARALEKR